MLATGELKAPMGTVNFYRQKIRMNIGRYGAKAYVQAVLKALSQPHKLRNSGEDQTMASYQYIVTHCFTAIRWRIWHSWAPYRLQDERKPAHKRTAGSRFAVLSAQRSRRKR